MSRVHSFPSVFARSLLFSSAAVVISASAGAQTNSQGPLPPVTVEAPQQKRAAAVRSPQRSGARTARASRVRNAPVAPIANDLARGPALTVLTVQQALRDIQQTPGGVAIVPAEAYRNSTVANTIKDVLDYVPGVFAQPKWGDDTRLSIRGSGLSRNFHLRGVSSTWTGSRSTPPTVTAISRKSIPPPTNMSRLPGRQCAAIWRQLAGRRHQLRYTDRTRSIPQRRIG